MIQNKTTARHLRTQKSAQHKGRRLLIRFLLLLSILCYGLFLLEQQIRPILHAVIEYESNRYAVTAFNAAIEAQLQQNPDIYRNLYEVTWDGDSVPTGVVANSYQINLVRSELIQQVLTQLIKNSQNVYQFRLGRLTGVQMLAAQGPMLSLKITPQSYVIADIHHTIETEGQNQTLLSVYATFTVKINVSMAGYLQTVTVQNEILLWQNLLLGRVPDVNV